tara:strand:- start:840 stop:1859 length:1020 start_codon:yes stop_codon:yes gene_type:complete
MSIVLKKTNTFAVFSREDIVKNILTNNEFQIKFGKYLPNKNEIINDTKLPKTTLVQELLSQKLMTQTYDQLVKYMQNLSDKDLMSKLERLVLESVRYNNTDVYDQNCRHIFYLTVKELHLRLFKKFKILSKINFKKYINTITEAELSYQLAYLMDYGKKTSDTIAIKKILMQETSNRQEKEQNDHLYLLSVYYKSKTEFKNIIKNFDNDKIKYNLASISTYTKNNMVREDIIRELMLALKNVELKKWLKLGKNIEDFAENVRLSEHIVFLLENSIKMNQNDFIESLEKIDNRTFLILYQQIYSRDFNNHWHHNTENFIKYFEIAISKKKDSTKKYFNFS